jgi:hypothetical protein
MRLLQSTKDTIMKAGQSKRSVKNWLRASVLLGAISIPCVAAAALGEPEPSVHSDMAELRGSIKVADRASYRVHEIQLSSGTVVREFTGPDGRVFAVSWSGPTIPNLRQTLGRYFDVYSAAAKANHSGHRQLQIHQDDLVIHAAGHMRAFSGLAYLDSAVPAGGNVEKLR